MIKRKRVMSLIAAGLVCVGTLQMTNKTEATSNTGTAKNVILLIADGMSQEAVTLARYQDEDQKLAMDEIASGGVRTYWKNGPITDSAPGGTAFATGHKTDKKNVGTSVDGQALATVLEASELMGKSTGLVATSEITHATPADFSSHTNNRSDYTSIIQQQANIGLDVILGGGMGSDSAYNKDGKTGADFKEEMLSEIKEDKGNKNNSTGYEIVNTKEEMLNSTSDKLWGMFNDSGMNIDINRNDEEPTLAEMTKKAINTLNKNDEGFFLVVEGSQIDWEAHANNSVGMTTEILAFDKAVEEAINFAKQDKDTVVIVTADHGNSGITIGNTGNSDNYSSLTFEESVNKYKDVKISESKFNSEILDKVKDNNKELEKSVSENFGITGLSEEEITKIKSRNINKVISDRFGIGFTTGGHTSEDVYLGYYGPNSANKLKGIIDNTDIADYVYSVLGGDETLKKSLDDITEEIYIPYTSAFNSEDKVNIDTNTDPHRPKATIETSDKDGKEVKLELRLNTNDYKIFRDGKEEGESGELKTVMPYIDGKFFVPQELINLVRGNK